MKAKKSISLACFLIAAALLAAGCGGSSSSSSTSTSAESAPAPAEGAPSGGEEAPSEAVSAATGDIPDNQVFLVYRDPQAGYSIRYPEGWARRGSGNDVTFQEKANTIHLVVKNGAPAAKEGEKVTSTRMSAPNPVTGKRLKIVIDRYEFGKGGKVAILDLATPEGVDNVDAYRLIGESFEWR